MFTFILKILKTIFLKLATTGALSFMQPWLLKVDKWAEEKLGIDIIKQDKKFHEKFPLVSERIARLERDSHPPVAPGGTTELKEMIAEIENRIKKLEKK
jgi:hypothetical protein